MTPADPFTTCSTTALAAAIALTYLEKPLDDLHPANRALCLRWARSWQSKSPGTTRKGPVLNTLALLRSAAA